MHAITLWPEWAFAIARLDKRQENRTWTPPDHMVGKRIAIHAGRHIGGRPGKTALQEGIEAMGAAGTSNGWSLHFESWPKRVKAADRRIFVTFDKRDGKPVADMDGSFRTAEIRTGGVVATAVLGEPVKCLRPSGWMAEGCWAWRLSQVQWLLESVECKGAQGLWKLPKQIATAVDEAKAVAMPEYF